MEQHQRKRTITLSRVLKPIMAVLMAAIVLMTFTNAALRYIAGTNVLSFEEYSRFCFVWICYLGTIIAFDEKRHICVDIITSHVSGRSKHTLELICQILVLVCSAVILAAGLIYLRRAVTNYSAATHTNMGIVVVGLPFMALSMIYIQLKEMYRMYIKKEVKET